MEFSPVEEMSDREIAEQSLILLRSFANALESLTSNPMISAMMPAPSQLSLPLS
jgi:hypothetical protein